MAAIVTVDPTVRISGQALAALCHGEFTGMQLRVVATICRIAQTGPRVSRRLLRARHEDGVRISVAGLAAEMGIDTCGSLVDSVRGLVRAGVLVVVDRGSGRRPPAYRVEFNVGRWKPSLARPWVQDLGVRHPPPAAQLAG